MRKQYRLIIMITILLFVSLTTTGCDTYYNIQAGKLTKCGDVWSGDWGCGGAHYQSSDGQTFFYCSSTFVVGCSPATPPVNHPATPSVGCVPKYAYDNLINQGQSWEVVSQQQDQNNSPSPAQVTFTSTTSKTVTVTDKLDVIANLNVNVAGDAGILIGIITANVKAEIDHEVTRTVNATIGNSYNFSVPSGKTAYANYGVKVQITSGHLYDKAACSRGKSDWGNDVTYVPIASGWCVWTSDQPASICPSL